MTENILIGYSGHAFVVADAALKSKVNIIGYADVNESQKNPYNLKYVGFELDEKFQSWNKRYGFILGIGDNNKRNKIGDFILNRKETLTTVIHPDSIISTNVEIESGAFIAAGVIVNSMATISNFAIINTGSIIEHDCKIESAAHIAPGVVLAGNVTVGKRTFIGANSVVREGVHIGNDVIVGAGTVVLQDVPNGKKVIGNPGRIV